MNTKQHKKPSHAKRKLSSDDDTQGRDGTPTSPVPAQPAADAKTKAAMLRAQIKERKKAMKRMKLEEKKAAKQLRRDEAEATRRASSANVDVHDEGWPRACTCRSIDAALWDSRVPRDVLAGHRVASSVTMHPDDLARCPTTYIPVAAVAIRRITETAHPACGQYGLFAAQYLAPRTHVIDYLGFVSDEGHCSTTSDYILRLVGDLSVDAELVGNQARFINDFRGVADRPNVELVLHDGPPPTMQVWTGSSGLSAGTELLLSYGKGFWQARQ